MSFSAVYLDKRDGDFSATLKQVDDDELATSPVAEGDVVFCVEYSTLNYKDALAITNRGAIVKRWPMVAGIDGAGVVESSGDARWRAGDRVILNGWGTSETHWGCLAQKARAKGDWLVALPASLSTLQAMAIGTAGYTAMLCCLAIEEHGVKPGDGEVLVTGATGGVGSIAILILGRLGYRVIASTGKLNEESYLRSLGAAGLIDRAELSAPGKPLQPARWSAVVDTVGSHTLANACAQTRYGGIVTACGLAQGMDFPATVAPFILRGVKLAGIESSMCPAERRQRAWARLAQEIDAGKLAALSRCIRLADVFGASMDIVEGRIKGRIVVDMNA